MAALDTLFKYIDEHQDLYVKVSFLSYLCCSTGSYGILKVKRWPASSLSYTSVVCPIMKSGNWKERGQAKGMTGLSNSQTRNMWCSALTDLT